MGVRLQRYLSGRDGLSAGQYFVDYLRHPIGGMFTAYVCCPKCGGIDALSDTHVVQPGGKVVPGWKCTTETCDLFEFLELDGFGEPVR